MLHELVPFISQSIHLFYQQTFKTRIKLPSIEVGPTALACSITLTFNPLRAMVITYTCTQKFKANGQLVPKIEWKQTDGRRRLHYLPR